MSYIDLSSNININDQCMAGMFFREALIGLISNVTTIDLSYTLITEETLIVIASLNHERKSLFPNLI